MRRPDGDDEVGRQERAFLPPGCLPCWRMTAYQPERDLRKRAEAAIATLTSQGRSVGVCVVGALQDPCKDVISLEPVLDAHRAAAG